MKENQDRDKAKREVLDKATRRQLCNIETVQKSKTN